LEEQVATAIERIVGAGHVLVFLPGAEEIRRAMRACEGIAQRKDLQIVPLHGDLSAEEQDRAVAGSARPKVILSTNVAESSITIEGVTAVVDSGLARIASYSAWSGLPTLQVTRVSQASANQRAGRAGRTGAGRVIRLYSADDFARRPAHDTPEITRADLSPAALALRAMQVESFGALEWLQPPPPKNIAHAEQLLRDLHAVDASGRLTEIGSEMARYPLHPRLARLVIEARRRGVAEDGCAVAAVLSAGERLPSAPPHRSRSDLLVLLEGDCERRTGHVLRQIRRIVNPPRQGRPDDDALLLSILSAYPDRVARRRSGQELLLASGGSAVLSNASTVDAEFLVAIEIEDRRDQRLPLVRLASAVDPEWLLELFPERIRENQEVQWHRTGERVEAVSALYFDQIVLEDRRSAPDPRSAAAMLAAKAMEAGIARFTDADAIDAWLARVAFAAAHAGFEPLGEAHVRAAVESLSSNLHSFSELSKVCESGGLLRALEDQSPAGGARMLDEIAPAHIRLPGGRQVRVHYEAGKAPWIASRLQDFFGMRETPRVARGRIPVVVHLLAPNQRPVQTTTDLAGFWERLYPQVRRELSRRYPKHSWPEDPNRVVHREAK